MPEVVGREEQAATSKMVNSGTKYFIIAPRVVQRVCRSSYLWKLEKSRLTLAYQP